MDGQRFDEIAVTWAGGGRSRRAALRALGAALLATAAGAARLGEAAAKGCAAKGKPCQRDGQCCSNKCQQGKCAGCPNGKKACGHGCVRTDRDPKHCGGCGNRCVAGQHCVAGACQCNNAGCAGCCDGTTCRPGDAGGSCGTNGAACGVCADGQACVGGSCACTAGSCASGCCAGNECKAGTADGFCGANGATCRACLQHQRCAGGACVDRACGAGGPCLAFLTSSRHTGNLGGLAGADAICQARANAANLPGTYMAWLSDSSASPATRFARSTGPYRRVDGVTIAYNWADLTGGVLAAPINVTETGAQGGVNARAWTNTLPSGAARPSVSHCRNWTDDNGPDGRVGWSLGFLSGDWTDSTSVPCVQFGELYCFQQG